jgi:hypothetical protein
MGNQGVVTFDLLPAQTDEVYLAVVVLGQSMEFAKLFVAVLAAVTQHLCLLAAF